MFVVVILIILVFVGIVMVWGAVGIGAANSWIFEGNFIDGWHMAWDKPWVLLGWSIIFIMIAGGGGRSSN